MNVETRINELCKNLVMLGYDLFQVESIMKSAAEQYDSADADAAERLRVVTVLENYEKLASDFCAAYSK